MTAPRRIPRTPTVYHIVRRTTQGEFLLKPEAIVMQIFLYVLGVAARRYDILLHGWITMTNHVHLLVTDTGGQLPKFMAMLFRLTARALNQHWGRTQNLWAAEQPCAVRLIESQDEFDALLYAFDNPLDPDLVERLSEWPGACSFDMMLSGEPLVVQRPAEFFSDKGPMPSEIELRVERLPSFAHLTIEAWAEMWRKAVARLEEAARARRSKTGASVGTRADALAVDHRARPSLNPVSTLRPHIACKNTARRVLELGGLRAFRAAYRRARREWIAGDREAEFPAGTYQPRLLGARCADDVVARPGPKRARRRSERRHAPSTAA